MEYRYVVWQGSLWRLDAALGFYEQLVLVRPEECEPSPADPIYPSKVQHYAEIYRRGSPFPPIEVAGPTPDDPLYGICNGHHRWSAAQLVDAPLRAWTSFLVRREGSSGPFWTTARMSETETGRILAGLAGMEWCPQCGTFLNYRQGRCLRCH